MSRLKPLCLLVSLLTEAVAGSPATLSLLLQGAALVNAAATSTTMWRLAMVNITELDLLCTEVEDGQTLETKLTFSGS